MRILPSPYVPRRARRFHWPHQSCRSECSLPAGLAHPTCCWGLLMFLSVPVFCYCTRAFLQVFQHLLSAGPWECHCLYSVNVWARAWVSVWQNKHSVLEQHLYFKVLQTLHYRTCINSCFVVSFQSLHNCRIQLWKTLGFHSNRSYFPKMHTLELVQRLSGIQASWCTGSHSWLFPLLWWSVWLQLCLKALPMPPAQLTALPAAFHSTCFDWMKSLSSHGSRQN